MEHKSDGDINNNLCTWNGPKHLKRGLEEMEIRGRAETIQITPMLRSARILKKVPETCCYSDSSERPSADAGEKNSKRVI